MFQVKLLQKGWVTQELIYNPTTNKALIFFTLRCNKKRLHKCLEFKHSFLTESEWSSPDGNLLDIDLDDHRHRDPQRKHERFNPDSIVFEDNFLNMISVYNPSMAVFSKESAAFIGRDFRYGKSSFS